MRPGRIVPLPWRKWAPAALVSALVLVGGARLIMLTTQQRIAENREVTAGAAERTASRVEAELGALAERARGEAARAVDVLGRLPDGRGSLASDEGGFWTASDGSIIPAAYPTEAAAARDELARQWRAGDGDSEGAETQWLAPVRHGSQWLIAVRAPILLSNGSAVEHAGWAVVYQPLEEMLLRAGVDELPEEGYEFTLGQRAPGSDAPRLLLGSPFAASPDDDLTRAIRLPDASRATVSSDPYIVLALRPSGGWYSPAGLTANIGLLLVITWLLGLAAYDLMESQNRWRAALALARQRLVATSRRLTEELEESRLLEVSFEHARFHDTFTGLPNRGYFMNRLDQALRDRGGRRQLLAVILMDIDRFKLINDTLGQTAGDELMVQVARRFDSKIGADADPGYVLARWSGDQFALLLFDVHSSDTALTFAKLLGEALVRPFILRRHTLSVAAHIGITCVDTELQRTEDVVREADIALSVAKRRGLMDPVVYEAALGEDVVSTVSLEADLHVALEREQFRLLFQPIVDLAAGGVVGAEALLRWRHPIEGLLAPDRFLPIAEDARLMVPISRWVIKRACTLGAEWRRHVRADTSFYVSVNLAATVLDDPHLVRYVADVLQETGLPAESLRFELTEGDLTLHVGAAREVLDALHDMGVGLILDDFGTGYSSLSYLELFPIDCVKIDRPFVNAADGSDSDVMRSVVHMASSLGLEAIAEKVETEAAVQALKRMGCKYGQGYLLGQPVESEVLLARVAGRPMPASPDAPTLAQLVLPDPAAPEVPTLVQRERPGTAAADEPTIARPGASVLAASDDPTVALAASSESAAQDDPTLVQAEWLGTAAADEPTVERPGVSDPAGSDGPTLNMAVPGAAGASDGDEATIVDEVLAPATDDDSLALPRSGRRSRRRGRIVVAASSESVVQDDPTRAQAERLGTAPADDPTVEKPIASEPAASEAPALNVAAPRADVAREDDELTIIDEALAPATDNSLALPRSGRRWRQGGRMSTEVASEPAASDAPPAPNVAAPGADAAREDDDLTIVDEALAPATDDDSQALPRSGRRWRRRAGDAETR